MSDNKKHKSKAQKRARFQRIVALALAIMMILSAFAYFIGIFL